jgi:2-polyprenyl-6-methoxyphenol hydroxylase-like FAD-dependent oxidoreductase
MFESESEDDVSVRVLVIGGGIGGLCLAHGLRATGADVRVYERGHTRDDWLQGYRIHISPAGSAALHACLPAAQWSAFEAGVADPGSGDVFAFRDEQLRTLVSIPAELLAGDPADPVARHRSVSRIRLRGVLLGGLDDVMEYGREFVRYELAPDRRVTAHFADGSSATGDVLVGADGANSRVRQQYLPHARRVDTGVLAVAGKHPLPGPQPLPDALLVAPNNIVPPRSSWMFTAPWRAGAPVPGQPVDDEQDYLLWSYAAATHRFPSDVLDRDGAALMRLVLECTASWSPDIRTMVANSDPSTVAALPLRTMLPVEPWPASPVTLIGDAIHNMTPMAGVGANTALRDAALLAQRLGAAGPDGLVAAIAGYEREMLDYGFAAVRTSLRNARQAASDRRLPRALFTTVLRTAEAVPAMKRRMFAGMGN